MCLYTCIAEINVFVSQILSFVQLLRNVHTYIFVCIYIYICIHTCIVESSLCVCVSKIVVHATAVYMYISLCICRYISQIRSIFVNHFVLQGGEDS